MQSTEIGQVSRWAGCALAIAGIVMIAFVVRGFPALRAIGVPVDGPIFDVIVLQLIIGGILFLIIGLMLVIRARPLWLIGSGAVLLCAGTGPLLAIGLMAKLGLTADPNPNPVGLGMLSLFTLIPALVLLIWGFVNWRSAKRGSR